MDTIDRTGFALPNAGGTLFVDPQHPADPLPSTDQLLPAARALASQHRTAEAKAAYRTAVRADASGAARDEFGRFLLQIEAFPEAIDQFTRLLAEGRQRGDLQLVSTAAHNLAAVYREVGQTGLARQFQQQAIQAENGCSEGSGLSAPLLSNRAADAILEGDLPLAKVLLTRAVLLEAATQSLAGLADDWGNLGVVAALEGELDRAVFCFWRAYRLHRAEGDERLMGRDLMNLGQVLRQAGCCRAAACCYRQAKRRFENAQADHSAQQADQELAECAHLASANDPDPSDRDPGES